MKWVLRLLKVLLFISRVVFMVVAWYMAFHHHDDMTFVQFVKTVLPFAVVFLALGLAIKLAERKYLAQRVQEAVVTR